MVKINVAVIFGGKSAEHEISVITGIQVLNALDKSKYNVLPVYVNKEGKWILGNQNFLNVRDFIKSLKSKKGKKVYLPPIPEEIGQSLKREGSSFLGGSDFKVDVFFPTFHGTYGEDGSMQGLFELANIPFVGCGVTASAIAMDKMLSKRVCESIGVDVLPANWITDTEWKKDSSKALKKLMSGLKFPVYIKPVHLGSSIGINKAENLSQVKNSLDVAFFYDTKVMVEQGLIGSKEINISLLGNNPYELSMTEMPVASSSILSFEDKYMSSSGKSKGMASAKRVIPAPIKSKTEEKIKDFVVRFFAEIGGEGISRVDFLVSDDESKVYLNEINPLPGSIAFYLWEKKGLKIDKLVEKLINLAFERYERRSKLATTFQSSVLEGFEKSRSTKLSS